MKTIYTICAFILLAKKVDLWESSESFNHQRELIRFTPNTLNQARFYELRKVPRKMFLRERMNEPPVLVCDKNAIGISFNQKFNGRIFSSHQENNPACVQYISKSSNARFVTNLDGPCGVKKLRVGVPISSIEFHLRVVISFDYDVLTEEDRIYDLTCVYSTKNISLDAYYDTVNFLQHPLVNSSEMPKCRYSIHKNNVDGPKTISAQMGEVIFHRWKCPSDGFAFKVYRCFVHSGKKQSYMIIDDNGCSLDEDILPHPIYDLKYNTVYSPAKAFRFSQSTRVHFNCLMAVCPKWDKECMEDIPPRCVHSHRKRQILRKPSTEQHLNRIPTLLDEQNSTRSEDLFQYTRPPLQTSLTLTSDGFTTYDKNPISVCDTVSTKNCLQWIYALSAINIILLFITITSCYRLMKNKWSMDVQKLCSSPVNRLPF